MAGPSVPEFYSGKTIFITGATGFMGKVLIEKLLRSCPDVKKIFMLMRPKKGQGIKERLDDFLKAKVFDHLHSVSPNCFEKLHVIQGDVLMEDMGISNDHREELQREAQIVFHCAACVRFDMPLRDAVRLNTVGTKRVLTLVKDFKNIEVFLHTSTSYCHCDLNELGEKLYPVPHRPEDVIECCRWMDDGLINHMEPKICEPQPNTYAYTKALTEDLVSQYQGLFPIAIARPSIVTAAFKEPMPGWVDNINGPTGIMIAGGKGVLRTMMTDESIPVDVIPVDMAVNACIVLAYTTAIDRPQEIRVCNVTQSGINSVTWGQALNMGLHHVKEYPFSVCLWYPGGSGKTSWLHNQLCIILFHIIPAYFIDLLLYLLGQKTFMVKLQKRISSGMKVLEYYTTKSWSFKNDCLVSFKSRLSIEDNEKFYTDMAIVNWSEYIRNYMKGCREYVMKEDPSTLPQAQRLLKQLYVLDLVVRFMFYAMCAYLVYKYSVVLFGAV